MFSGVSADNRVLFSSDYSTSAPRSSTDVGANGSFHALATIPDAQPSMMVLSSDAAAENARLDTMYFSWGGVFQVDLKRIGTLIDVGMVINFTHSRHGFSNGVNVTAIGVEDKPTDDIVTVKFFVAIAAYAPGQL